MTVMNRVHLTEDIKRILGMAATVDLRTASEREVYLLVRRMVHGILAAFDRHYGVR
jgi:hypothetical protein